MSIFMNRRRGGIMNTLVLLIVLGALGFLGYNLFFAPSDEEKKVMAKQATPEAALNFYSQAVYDYNHDADGTRWDQIKMAVDPADWDWYSQNYPKLHQDHFNLSSGINPTDADVLARRAVLTRLLSVGPTYPNPAVINRTVEDANHVTLRAGYQPDEGVDAEIDVRLVKVGKTWRVRDFAGGRPALEGTAGPKPTYTKLDKSGAPAAAPGAGAPGAAQPALPLAGSFE